MVKLGILALAAALTAAGAIAAQPDESEAAAAASASPGEQAATEAGEDVEPAEERKICRTNKATGSLTRRTRVCLTQAQWREIHDRTRRGVGEMQGSASGAGRCISAMDAACGAPGPGGVVGS